MCERRQAEARLWRLRRWAALWLRCRPRPGAGRATIPRRATSGEWKIPTTRNRDTQGCRAMVSSADDSLCAGCCDRAGFPPGPAREPWIGISCKPLGLPQGLFGDGPANANLGEDFTLSRNATAFPTENGSAGYFGITEVTIWIISKVYLKCIECAWGLLERRFGRAGCLSGSSGLSCEPGWLGKGSRMKHSVKAVDEKNALREG